MSLGGFFTSDSQTRNTTSIADNRVGISDNYAPVSIPHIQLGRGARLTLNESNDPQIVHDALAAVTDQAARNSLALASTFGAAADSQQSIIDKTFGALSDLASNQQTGGESGRNKIVLYIALGALALAAYLASKHR